MFIHSHSYAYLFDVENRL